MGSSTRAATPRRISSSSGTPGAAINRQYIETAVCWAESEEIGQTTAYEQWPTAANKGELNRVLPTPTHYEQAAKMATPEDVAEHVVCGPDPEVHIKKIEESIGKGFDHVCIHQIGQQQREFMEFYRKEVLPHFTG